MVSLKENEAQPNAEHLSAARARMKAVVTGFPGVKLWNVHLHQEAEKKRKIIETVMGGLKGLIHVLQDTLINSENPTHIPGK